MIAKHKVRKVLLHFKKHGRFIRSFQIDEATKHNQGFCVFEVEIEDDFFLKIKVFRFGKLNLLTKGITVAEAFARHFKLEIDDSCSHHTISSCLRSEIENRRKGLRVERNFEIDSLEIIKQGLVPGLTGILKSLILDDMNNHFDFIFTYHDQPVKIDCKSSRSGQKSQRAKKSGNSSIMYRRFDKNRQKHLEIFASLLERICKDVRNLHHANHL